MKSAVQRQETEVPASWREAVRVWWALAWRAALIGLVASGGLTLLLGTVGRQNETLNSIIYVFSAGFSIAVEIWLIRHMLRQDFGSFRIAVLRKES